MAFRLLYISLIFVILLSASIDALRYRSVRHKRDVCPNPVANACSFVTCENGGQCFEDRTTLDCYRCQCTAGYTGKVCDTTIIITPGVCNPVCQNGGQCNVNVCVCPTGYSGAACEIRDFCLPINPCQNGGRCTSNGAGYVCDCTGTGYSGTICTNVIPTNPCSSNPCQNGGQCSWDGVTTTCVCVNGFTGAFCQVAPVPCAATPCQNGGQCELLATNTYGCVCVGDFTGTQCETSILVNHPCVTMPETVCLNGGICTVNGANYLCNCATGWTGTNCEIQQTTSSCNPSPCGVHGNCIEATVGSGTIAYCNCDNQWTGKYCDVDMGAGCPVGYCITGTCQIVGNAPYCTCPASYTGQRCDTLIGSLTTIAPISSCSPNPCQNAGTCYVFNNAVVCSCVPNWTGPTCLIPETVTVSTTLSPVPSPCSPNPCLSGGTCYKNGNAFVCVCQTGWTGTRCEYNQGVIVTTPNYGSTCANQPCLNGGTCYNGANSYVCICSSVYTGTNCESIVAINCPLNCAPGYCIPSSSSSRPYACDCNGVLKLTSCV